MFIYGNKCQCIVKSQRNVMISYAIFLQNVIIFTATTRVKIKKNFLKLKEESCSLSKYIIVRNVTSN
jgi:hypothetical protein